MLTPNDADVLLRFIDTLLEHQSNAGCNDFTLPATEANLELVAMAELENGGEVRISERGEIFTLDFLVLEELKRRLLK